MLAQMTPGKRRVAAVAEERRLRARVGHHARRDLIQVTGGDAGPDLGPEHVEDVDEDGSRGAHAVDLGRALDRHGTDAAHRHPRSPSAARRQIDDVRRHAVDRQHAIDPVDNALSLVVVDDLAHRRHLLLEAGADDLGPIVVALHELVALEVAVTGHARRLADLVVRGAAGRADPAAGQALHELLVRHVDEDDAVDALPLRRERLVERGCLRHGARESVEDGAARRLGLGQLGHHQADRRPVRDELAALHVLARLVAEGGPGLHRGPKEVARGEVRDAELTRDGARLCALAGAGRPDEQDDRPLAHVESVIG